MNKRQEIVMLLMCIERVVTSWFWEDLFGGPFTYYMGQYAFELAAMVTLQMLAKTAWVKKCYGFFVGVIVYGIFAMITTDPMNPQYDERASVSIGVIFLLYSILKPWLWQVLKKLWTPCLQILKRSKQS